MRLRRHDLPRQSGRDLRWRLAALIAAAVTALSAAMPGALASPTPPPPTGASQSPANHLPPPLLPRDTKPNNDKAMKEAAQRLAADPLGRELIKAWSRWDPNALRKGAPTSRLPANISVEWFDFNWMKDAGDLPDWLRSDVEQFFDNLLQAKEDPVRRYADYEAWAKEVDDPAIYGRLGVPRTGLTFQLATGSKKWEGHSEENGRDWMRGAVERALRLLGGSQRGKKEIKPLTEKIVQRSPQGLAGIRTPCVQAAHQCATKTANVPPKNVVSLVYYDEAGTPDATLARQVVPTIMPMARSSMGKRAAQQVDSNLGLSDPSCLPGSSVGAPKDGDQSAGGQVVAMAARPLAARPPAADCGGSESGALGKALGSGDYGGVDFSSLELRYISDPGSGGVRFSFSGRQISADGGEDIDSGLDALTDTSADLRTWLVLNPNDFWVNLNPSEPDRIVDPVLGQTNAGRALLEADLQMKRTAGRLLDPDTDFGARYWKAMVGTCYTTRLWIVPGDVRIREDGSSLYILKAALNVKAQTIHIEDAGKPTCTSDPESDARNERLERTMVVPKVVQAVNTAPDYAPIRRAFMARIVAQWIRDRHQQGHRTSFDNLIDSGDIGPVKLQNGWQPKQVFDSFVRSIREGDFTYKQTVREGNTIITRTMMTGGVDFSTMPMGRIDAAQMEQQHPRLPQTVKASRDHPASASDGSIWLGDTAGAADNGLWSRTTGALEDVASGRTGLLILLLVALGVVVFGIRGPRRKRRAP
jgi:hypothetical protein